jgi:hypothetical protein
MEYQSKEFTNELSPAQAERLAILAQECSEVVHACTMALRHGLDSHSPNDPNKVTNRQYILNEIGDVSAAMFLLLNSGDLPNPPSDEYIYSKLDRLKKYTHHQNL